jgi:transposase
MLHLGIDLHQSQITIVLLDETGDVVRRGTVPTKSPAIDEFLTSINAETKNAGGYRAIVEECGFTHWLIERLNIHECDLTVVVQPLKRARHKTDRRDAATLAEILWVNRDRLQAGRRLHGIRQVMVPTEDDRQDRLLTGARIRFGRDRTQAINQIKALLRRFNLMHDCPTKGIQTKKAKAWLRAIELPRADRLVLDLAVARWECLDDQMTQLDQEIDARAEQNAAAQLVKTIPGAGNLTALTLASRIGSIDRFPRPSSLANMFGLTPSINDTGETTGRIGAITKHGHPHVRFLLGQMVSHLTRKDPQVRAVYRKIRKRRGAKTALVAVMRRIACRIWHMFRSGEGYRIGMSSGRNGPTPGDLEASIVDSTAGSPCVT